MGLSLHRVCELHELSGCLRPIVAARAERLLFSEPVVQIEDLGDSDRLLPARTSHCEEPFLAFAEVLRIPTADQRSNPRDGDDQR